MQFSFMGLLSLNGEIDKSEILLALCIIVIASTIAVVSGYDTKHAEFATYILLASLVILILISYRIYIKTSVNFIESIEEIIEVENTLRFPNLTPSSSLTDTVAKAFKQVMVISVCEKYRLLALNADNEKLAEAFEEKRILFESLLIGSSVHDSNDDETAK